jgi:acetyl esterase/lipase
MKQFFQLLFIPLFIVACSKDKPVVVADTKLPAQQFSNVSYGSDPSRKMDIYLPEGRSPDSTRMIVMVHGGAWSMGDKTEFNTYVHVLQQRLPEYAIANINYRLASTTSNHFPSQEEDMKVAMQFLVQQAAAYHISDKFVLLGASAGAHMALLQAYKNPSPTILGVVDFFGPADLVDMYNSMEPGSMNQFALQLLLNGTPATNATAYAESSPINYVSTQSPPTIILHGEADNLVNIAQSVSLKNKLLTYGVVSQLVTYPGVGHEIWPDEIMNNAFDKVETFIRANVH